MEKIIAKHILDSIRKHLNNDKLSDEEKLDYIMLESGTKLSDLASKAAYPIEPLSIHVAKQLLFSNLSDWTKEMVNKFIEKIDWYLDDIKSEGYKIDFIEERFEIVNLYKANKLLNKAIKDVQDKAIKKKINISKVQNNITPEEFMKVWEAFYKQLLPILGSDHDFSKEEVQEYLEIAVKKAGLDIHFKWQ